MWFIWFIIGLIVFALVFYLGLPMKISREPGREKEENLASVVAYDKVSRWFIFTFERYLILHYLNRLRPAGILVDLGCGPGYLVKRISKKYPGLSVIGLDNNEDMLRLARQNLRVDLYPNVGFLGGDAEQVPLADCSVDFIVSSLSLHHWRDTNNAYREISRVLKIDGQFLIFDLRRNSPRFFYYCLLLGRLISPKPLQKTNGAVGSFWSSFTPFEVRYNIISQNIFSKDLEIRSGFGWMTILGHKPAKSSRQ